MAHERFICRAVDASLPPLERYCSHCLFAWQREHPSARKMSHDVEVSSNRIVHDGQQHQVRMIVFNVYYHE